MTFFDILNNCLELAFQCWVKQICTIIPDDWFVCRNLNNLHIVDFTEFFFFRFGRTGHSRKFFVHPEIVLESNGRHCFGFVFDLNIFFGFNCLVQSVRITTAVHNTPSKLIDDQHFSVLNDIVKVADHDIICPQCLIHVVRQRCIFDVI